MSNFPGPYEVEIVYNMSGRSHRQRLNVDLTNDPDVGADFSEVQAITRDGGTRGLDDALDDYLAIVATLYNTAAGYTNPTLWKYVPGTYDREFRTVYTGAASNGTSSNPTIVAGQSILTFRTYGGGIMKLNFMECITQMGPRISCGALGTEYSALRDELLSAGNVFLARDNTYPASCLRLSPGQNEAIFKNVYRP